MAEVTIRVCDVCQQGDDVTTYRITRDGESRVLDLCDKHNGTIEEMFKEAQVVRRGVRQRRTFSDSVTTLEEIEKRKRTSA